MERLTDIALFLRVVELGSISAAARSLDLSPAVASQRLKRLEQELEVRLLHRSTRRLHVTPEGHLLVERGRALLDDMEDLTAALRSSAQGATGTLRVALPPGFGRQYISPLLPDFLARHPGMGLNVHLSDELVDLVGEGFDLAIRIGELADSSLVAQRLAIDRRVICASPDYLRRRGIPKTPADLAEHDCLLLTTHPEDHHTWHLHDLQGRSHSVRVKGSVQANEGALLSQAAVAGLGVAQHSVWHIHEQLCNGTLVQVLPDFRLPETAIYAVMPQRRLVPARVQAFVTYLKEWLGEIPPWERELHGARED
ncbi:LysR family transcriptional regulator [Gilvimarinus sp. F26214L]|uniref:LysR family transcriptional regulator n=1 Tax=Gilvimarinus sp. DZF01 TaxID=3461371 RepID=UPI004045AE09